MSVYVKTSSIPDAGLGLFAATAITKGATITEYCGEKIDHKEALARRARGIGGYIRVIEAQHSYIDGIKDPDKASRETCGSFVNDGGHSGKADNAVFERKWNEKAACYRVFIRAKRNIDAGEEIFASYGKGYWK